MKTLPRNTPLEHVTILYPGVISNPAAGGIRNLYRSLPEPALSEAEGVEMTVKNSLQKS
jgi:hypothetical protein